MRGEKLRQGSGGKDAIEVCLQVGKEKGHSGRWAKRQSTKQLNFLEEKLVQRRGGVRSTICGSDDPV